MPWPDEKIRELRELHATGLSYSKIADRLGVTKGSAISNARALGLPRRRHGGKAPLMNAFWTFERLERLRELHGADLSYRKIGDRLGISKSGVEHKILALGLPRRGPRGRRATTKQAADPPAPRQAVAAPGPEVEAGTPGWPAEKIQEFRKLYAAGVSFPDIGERLGVPVLAARYRARRLGLPGRPKGRPPRLAPPPPAIRPDRKIQELEYLHRLADSLRLGKCRFPIGDILDGSLYFCAAMVREEGAPYCETHHELCHRRERADEVPCDNMSQSFRLRRGAGRG